MLDKVKYFIGQLYARVEKILNNEDSHIKYKKLINFLLVTILLGFFFQQILREYSAIVDIKVKIRWIPVAVALLLYGLNLVFFSLAWHLLINGYTHRDLLINLKLYFQSQTRKVLPTAIWFITNRLTQYSSIGVSRRITITSIASELILHVLVGLSVLGVINVSVNAPLTGFYLLPLLPLIYLIIYPQILNINFVNTSDRRYTRLNVTIILLLYLSTWLIGGIYFDRIWQALGMSAQIATRETMSIWIISSLVAYLSSFLLGGFGILREFSLVFLLSGIIHSPDSILIAALSRLVMTVGNIVFPVLLMLLSDTIGKLVKGVKS